MYEVRQCTAGQRSSPYRGFDGFSLGCLLGVFPLGGPKGRFDDCQISAKQKDDINTTKTKIARKH